MSDPSIPAALNPTINSYTGDLIALGSIAGWFIGALPSIATILAIAYYACQIYQWWKTRNQLGPFPTKHDRAAIELHAQRKRKSKKPKQFPPRSYPRDWS
jgi:hypothetical protein